MDSVTVALISVGTMCAGLLAWRWVVDMVSTARRYTVVRHNAGYAVVDTARADMVVGTFTDEDTAYEVAARLEVL